MKKMAKSEDVIILDDSEEEEPKKVQTTENSSSPNQKLRKRKSNTVISVDTSDDDDEPLINHRRSLLSAKQTTPVKQPVTNSDFEFKRPPECPVFYPTKEQFENSLDYINSLSEYGEKYGIIRIVPPKGWAPRFSIEEKKFRFIPRLQNLKKVDLKNRTKHEFFEKVKRFWEERDGKPFHVPVVEGRKLNIYQMHRVIAANGGFAKVNVDKLWPEIALTMGYRSHWAPYIKRHFKSILLPMEHLISTHRKETKRPMRACVSESSTNDEIATFGFEMSNNCYSLSQFETVADKFKSNYFKTSQPKDIPLDVVERNYWRIVTSNNDEENAEDVEVEYGADLNATGSGSGFPSNGCTFVLSNDQKYIDSSWNLNNIPLMENSVLSLINADISGMKSPWLYVGMLFSTFCWHTEDHWTSSINYLHIGEPKTWYGVPRSRAADFENVMKSMSPELFDAQPDLLHQLVTTMNPQILMEHGIPVYRTDQRAGEFIVTFPRAYHAGFNQGFNFAEAVNFALPAWVKVGRECIEHYASVGRGCVFSHDELVCRIAIHSDRISTELAKMCMDDLEIVIERELQLRKKVKQMGIEESERELFEVIPDDDRQCMKCQTTCFLSALVTINVDEKSPSSSDTNKIYCLKHYEDTDIWRLPPSEYMLKYRYTVDELGAMIKKLRTRILKSEAPSATNTNNTSCKLESKHDFKQKIMLKDEC